jgi:hypothetical protein
MTPLEAARKIAEISPDDETYQGPYDCHFCAGTLMSQCSLFPVTGHKEDCPWLAMPQIVAALEELENMRPKYHALRQEIDAHDQESALGGDS